MTPQELREQFDVLAEAPNGIEKLRELVLQLAVRGGLSKLDGRTAATSSELSQRPHVRLGDVATFVMGQAPPGAACNTSGTGTVFVKAGEFGDRYPVIREWTTKPLKLAKRGDVLICVVGATSGKLNLGIDCAIGRSVAAIRPSADLDDVYLYRTLQLQVMSLRSGARGSAQGVISRDDLSKIQIALPSLVEQRRIVAKVDELMALCDELEARQQRRVGVRTRLNRAALYHLTNSNEAAGLTHQWNLIRENFEMMFDSPLTVGELRRMFVDQAASGQLGALDERAGESSDARTGIEGTDWRDLPTDWTWTNIGSLGADPSCPVQTGPFGAQLHKTDFLETGVPVIAVGNLTGRGFSSKGLYFIAPEKAASLSRYDVNAGDVLFARSGATLGKVCVAPPFVRDWRMTGHILRARLDHTRINPHFLVYLLWGAQIVQQQVMAGIQGTTRPGYNTTLLERIMVPLPPIAHQAALVTRLDELMSLCDALECGLTEAREKATHLAAAIVHRVTAA